jgi:hypothetical protein
MTGRIVVMVAVALLAPARAAHARAVPLAGLEMRVIRFSQPRVAPVVINTELSAEVPVNRRISLFGVLPHTTVADVSCCHGGIGAPTAGLRYRLGRHRPALDGLFSLSAPAASRDGKGGLIDRYNSSAQAARDVGLYMPQTTTLRAGLAARWPVAPRLALLSEGGVQLRRRDGGAEHQFAARAAAGVTLELSRCVGLDSMLMAVADRTAIEGFGGAFEVGARYAGPRYFLRASLNLPLGAEARQLAMYGVGLAFGRRM